MRTVDREIVGGFIFSNDGHILLGKSLPGGVYPDHFMVPGGGIEPGETKKEAVIRETFEEVGIDLKSIESVIIEQTNDVETDVTEKTLRDTGERVLMHMQFNDFRIDIPKPAREIALASGDDFRDAEWIPVANLSGLKIPESTKATLRKLGLTP